MKCDADIRNDLHAGVVLYDGVPIFHGTGEHMAKKCNVRQDRDFCFGNSERCSQVGHKAGPS